MFCPKGCKGKYSGKQYMSLEKDTQGVPMVYRCPQCGFTHQLTLKEKILEIIYGAKWDFGGEEVDEHFIEDEDEDRVVNLLVQVIEGR